MRIKKPLLSTFIFAGILLVGIVIFYILVSNALETDGTTINKGNTSKLIKIEATA